MAELKGKNATVAKGVNGATKIPSGEHVGRVRCLLETVDFTTVAASASDTVLLGAPLQAGARVLEVVVSGPALAGSIDVGWQANVQDALDADGFIAAGSIAAASKIEMAAGAPGLGKKFESETQIFGTFSAGITAGANKYLNVWVYYVLD